MCKSVVMQYFDIMLISSYKLENTFALDYLAVQVCAEIPDCARIMITLLESYTNTTL